MIVASMKVIQGGAKARDFQIALSEIQRDAMPKGSTRLPDQIPTLLQRTSVIRKRRARPERPRRSAERNGWIQLLKISTFGIVAEVRWRTLVQRSAACQEATPHSAGVQSDDAATRPRRRRLPVEPKKLRLAIASGTTRSILQKRLRIRVALVRHKTQLHPPIIFPYSPLVRVSLIRFPSIRCAAASAARSRIAAEL